MKEIIYRLILCGFCAIFVFINVNNFILTCDSHTFICNQYNCTKCLNVQNAKETLKILFCSNCLIFIIKNRELIFRIIEIFKSIINLDVLLLKVQLNE